MSPKPFEVEAREALTKHPDLREVHYRAVMKGRRARAREILREAVARERGK